MNDEIVSKEVSYSLMIPFAPEFCAQTIDCDHGEMKECPQCLDISPVQFFVARTRVTKCCCYCRQMWRDQKLCLLKNRTSVNIGKETKCSKCYNPYPIETHLKSGKSKHVRETKICKCCMEKKYLPPSEVVMEDKKRCSKCHKWHPLESHFRSVSISETKMCKQCRLKQNNTRQNIRWERYCEIKKKLVSEKNGCEWPDYKCEEIDVRCIQFDHINPDCKSFEISKWSHILSLDESSLINEISKCRLLCAFHHNINSARQRKNKQENCSGETGEKYKCFQDKELVLLDSSNTKLAKKKLRMENKIKLSEKKIEMSKCSMCARVVTENECEGFDFDHLDQYQKFMNISTMVRHYSWKKIVIEMDKCRLLCANCHRKHTVTQQKERIKNGHVFKKRKRYTLTDSPHSQDFPKNPHTKGDPIPNEQKLRELVKRYSITDVGKLYNVHAAAIRYWCHKRGINITTK